MYVYLLDYAEKELKFSSTDATYLLSVIGIINTVGEVLIGWIGDQQWTNLNALYAICMLACGISTALVPFLTIYRSLAIVAGKYYMTMHKLHHLIELKYVTFIIRVLIFALNLRNIRFRDFCKLFIDIAHAR